MKKYILLISLCFSPLFADMMTRSIWQEHETNARYAVVQVINYSETANEFEPFKPIHDEQKAGGSAFFINEKGELITNYHVIQGAKRLYIMLPSIDKRKRFEIELVGCKPNRDIALCRLTEKGMREFKTFLESVPGCNGIIQYLDLAPEDNIRPVEPIMALGYPLLDGFKRTLGEVSGISMQTGNLFCQITAPINSGSSGGPTLNEHGQVIGINTAGIPGASVVGFMVPVRYVRNAIADLRAHKVLTLSIGAILLPTTSNILDTLSCKHSGLLVAKVLEKTFSDDLGLKKGDILMAINGHRVDNDGLIAPEWIDSKIPYFDVLEALPVGEPVSVTVWRDGEEVALEAPLPAINQLTIDTVYHEQGSIPYSAFGGIVLQPLRQNHMALAQDANGAVNNISLLDFLLDTSKHMKKRIIITKVYAGTQAELEPALYPGAMIDTINNHKVRTLDDVRAAVASSEGDFLTIECTNNARAALHIPTLMQEDEYLREVHGYEAMSFADES